MDDHPTWYIYLIESSAALWLQRKGNQLKTMLALMVLRSSCGMAISGYFGIQDAIVVILAASMAFSLIRKSSNDSTRWIPLNSYTIARLTLGGLLLAVTILTIGRHPNIADYAISFTGALLFLIGSVFFFGAKSPYSTILVEDKEYGAALSPVGLYRYVRHPYFFGLLLCSIGLPIYLVSLPGLLVAVAGAFPLLLQSSRALDSHWANRTGSIYEKYRSAVRLFVPSLKSKWSKTRSVQRV